MLTTFFVLQNYVYAFYTLRILSYPSCGGYGHIGVFSMAKDVLAEVACIQRAIAFGTIVYG